MQIEVHTLVDITKTGISRNVRPNGAVLSYEEWNKQRNQQRNWDVVIQLLGLRFQPAHISDPVFYKQDFFENYTSENELTIWKFSCRFDNEFPIHLLKEDFNEIPIITGLNESIVLDKSCFITIGEKINLRIDR